MRVVFPLTNRRRHPLAQALSLVLGLIVIGILMIFGLVVAGVLMIGGIMWLIWRQWKQRRHPAGILRGTKESEVLEGEYVVVRRSRPVTH